MPISLERVPGAAGVDEAGRGALAGPVVVAAVILPPEFDVTGLQDSKKLTAAQREFHARRIQEGAVFSIAFVHHEEIDRINILQATFKGMRQVIEAMPPGEILIDGNAAPPGVMARTVVKGDGKYAEIAAASILAKTARDGWMSEIAKSYPEYGFERHFGYGAPEHLLKLEKHGPCEIHRRSFEPIKSMVNQLCLNFEI